MMRHSLFALFALLFGTVAAFTQSLEIALDGPWIYYVDDQFKDEAGQPVSVLIAMAPAVDKHVATFSTGDGFVIQPAGVYCVGFDEICATRHSGNKPTFPGKLLRVRAPGGSYWYDHLNPGAIYLILPLPDSYSNDGVYRVKFGSKFGKPEYYGSEKKHSIGIFLHYATGPDTINLSSGCIAAKADSCPFDGYFQDQDNSGTLRISVKAPNDPNDHCDNHVRDAYHKMLLAIHSGSLTQGININQLVGYIDLPEYDSKCYDTDPQNDGNLLNQAKHMDEQPPALDVTAQLNKIVADLGESRLADYHLFLPELTIEAKSLRIKEDDPSKGKVPLFSQLTHIQLLLDSSMTAIDHVQAVDDKTRSLLKKAKGDEIPLARYAERIRAGSSGKDCRVSQMLIK